jgi:hypothetical protein
VITAATTNNAGYTLWGFKPSDAAATYTSKIDQIPGAQLDSSAATFGSQGFLITAATTNNAGYTLWGFKRNP